MITREKEPANLEMPFAELEGRITPTEKFYVRSHFPTPACDLKRWRLTVDGCVRKALKFTLGDLQKLETRTIEATMECAGNSRIFLKPKVKGVQWELGAVGNAKWTGVTSPTRRNRPVIFPTRAACRARKHWTTCYSPGR